jgi:hypothetical protein
MVALQAWFAPLGNRSTNGRKYFYFSKPRSGFGSLRMRSNSQLHNQISCCDSSTLARSIAHARWRGCLEVASHHGWKMKTTLLKPSEPRLQSHHENDALLLTHYLFR